jgi:alpha-ketoglutarate-dependent taurine dioxygenase
MPVVIGQIPGAFPAEVGGVECGAPLAAPDARAIDAAMDRYAVLVFRNQPLTDEQQLALPAISANSSATKRPATSASATSIGWVPASRTFPI